MPKLAVTEGSGKRVAILARVTPAVREGLEAAAGASGRSLSQEIETRLQASMELDVQVALQDEIKAEMRGTIASLEARIAIAQEWQSQLWPDESARVLAKAFSMALSAARYAAGQDWRNDRSAPLIVAGVVRRVMERYSRDGASAFTEMFDGARIAATADGIVQAVSGNLDKLMPALPPLQPQDDPALWTPRAFAAATFRDRGTGQLLQVVKGPEFDVADPEALRDLGPDHSAAVDRLRPMRDMVDDESFLVRILKDGSTVWDSLSWRDRKIHVPAGQDAPPARVHKPEEPAFRQATPEEIASMAPARGQLPPEIGDRAAFDDAVAGLPLVQAERKASVEDAAEHAIAPAPKRRAKAKA